MELLDKEKQIKKNNINYVEKLSLMVTFVYNLYIFVWIQYGCNTNMGFAFDPSNSTIKRLWCSRNGLAKTNWLDQQLQSVVDPYFLLPGFKLSISR